MKSRVVILYVVIIVLLVTCMFFFQQKKNLTDNLKSEISALQEQNNQSQSIREKEIVFQAKSFFPEKWVLNDYNNKIVHGVDIFSEQTLLVLFVPPESCSPCLENEIKEMEAYVNENEGLTDRLVIITSYKEPNEFKAFSNSLKLKNIRIYNRYENIEQWANGTACYFVWKNKQVSSIYIPRMNNLELNLKFREEILALVQQQMTLYIINDQEILKSKNYIYELDVNKMESITVIDSENGQKQYGDIGKNGVYIIKLVE